MALPAPFLFPMNNLYTNHPGIYEMMYQTFINYDEECSYYSEKLKKYKAQSILELGCGTGSLAGRLIKKGFNYTGLDINKGMLDLAKNKNPGAEFLEADMRHFQLQEKKQACLIAGRTISYLMTNQDALDSFNTIHKTLHTGGIVCFDSIDALQFIPSIKNGKRIIHKAEFGGRKFQRESYWTIQDNTCRTFNWDSDYFEEDEKGRLNKIAEDNSTLRCFTKDDLSLLLELCNFRVAEIEDRPSYAFDTFVMIAQKN